MKQLNYILYILIFPIVLGCETDLKLELNESGGNLVLFSIINPDSLFTVHLSKSVSHSSMNDFDRVYDGYIVIKQNHQKVDSFIWPYQDLWKERSAIKIEEGDIIEVIAGDNNKIASGTSHIPEAIKISSVEFKHLTQFPMPDNIQCVITFTDTPEKENYYQLIMVEKIWEKGNNSPLSIKNIRYLKDDQVFYVRDQEGSLLRGIDFIGTFSNHLITQSPYQLKTRIPKSYFEPPASNIKKELNIRLLTLSKDYYDYIRSRVISEYNQRLPVVNPVKIHTNIVGGLGLIGSYSVDTTSYFIIGEDYD